jgi:hypothetical protein
MWDILNSWTCQWSHIFTLILLWIKMVVFCDVALCSLIKFTDIFRAFRTPQPPICVGESYVTTSSPDTPSTQKSSTSSLLWHHWLHSQRPRVKFWWSHQNCYTVHMFPNVLIFFILSPLHSCHPCSWFGWDIKPSTELYFSTKCWNM